MSRFTRDALAVCSIAIICVIAYVPAVDNSFISDDFGIFPFLKALEENPSYIFEAWSELFRVTSYAYFLGLFKAFGTAPEPYYWAGIALHALVSVLVYFLVLRTAGSRFAAWPAAAFFAAYERHHEAVMWISAVNETILALNCVLFMLLWDYGLSGKRWSRAASAVGAVVFVFALFSKEAAVVLAPLAVLTLMHHGYGGKRLLFASLPVLAAVTAFAVLWLSQANRNFFVTDGHYAPGFHFVPVYGRALIRLMSPAVPFVAALLVLRKREGDSPLGPGFVLFAAILLMAILPYSFLTYQDHLPSRHTYLPSVGLAGLVGVFCAAVYSRVRSGSGKHACIAIFAGLIAVNITYIWLKKEPQFRERAAPTRDVIRILNSEEGRRAIGSPVYVCGFPMQHPWWFGDAISRFTPFSSAEVILDDNCRPAAGSLVLNWDPSLAQYSAAGTQARAR
jgi:hypothetical protein